MPPIDEGDSMMATADSTSTKFHGHMKDILESNSTSQPTEALFVPLLDTSKSLPVKSPIKRRYIRKTPTFSQKNKGVVITRQILRKK